MSMSLNVLEIPIKRGHEESIPSPGTQAHVYAIKETLGGDRTNIIDQTFRKLEFLHGVRCADKQQVNIGAVIQFFGAMFTHGNHNEIFCGDATLLAGEIETSAHKAICQIRELLCYRAQIIERKQVT